MDCEHSEGNDPRRVGRCVKCDAVIPATTRPRNLEFEAETVRFAARGVSWPEALLEHMQMRSITLAAPYVRDPLTVKLGVDHLLEAREEMADCANRLVWWLEENREHPEFYRKLRALALLVETYELCAEED